MFKFLRYFYKLQRRLYKSIDKLFEMWYNSFMKEGELMGKSVYSIVLSDEVVEAVDSAAYMAGMSRSAYINKVLAQSVSYVTPEQRISDIFTAVERLMDGTVFRIMPRPSESAFAVRSALRYRYKPVIRYSVELCRAYDRQLAEFRAVLRTQSAALLTDFAGFTKLWMKLETEDIGKPPDCSCEDGKFTRTFDLTPEQGSQPPSDNAIAEYLSNYITIFDKVLNVYLANAEQPEIAAKAAETRYKEYHKLSE